MSESERGRRVRVLVSASICAAAVSVGMDEGRAAVGDADSSVGKATFQAKWQVLEFAHQQGRLDVDDAFLRSHKASPGSVFAQFRNIAWTN